MARRSDPSQQSSAGDIGERKRASESGSGAGIFRPEYFDLSQRANQYSRQQSRQHTDGHRRNQFSASARRAGFLHPRSCLSKRNARTRRHGQQHSVTARSDHASGVAAAPGVTTSGQTNGATNLINQLLTSPRPGGSPFQTGQTGQTVRRPRSISSAIPFSPREPTEKVGGTDRHADRRFKPHRAGRGRRNRGSRQQARIEGYQELQRSPEVQRVGIRVRCLERSGSRRYGRRGSQQHHSRGRYGGNAGHGSTGDAGQHLPQHTYNGSGGGSLPVAADSVSL